MVTKHMPADGVAPSFRVYESLVLLLNYTGGLQYSNKKSQERQWKH